MTHETDKNEVTTLQPVKVPQTLVTQIANTIALEEVHRHAFENWLQLLVDIHKQDVSPFKKGKAAIAATLNAKVIWPSVKILASEIKKHGWDNRSIGHRFGLGGAAVGLTLFGGQGAGIAALGTAVGVPLWIVFGAGSMFAHQLVQELQRNRLKIPADEERTHPHTIDITPEKPDN